MRLALLLALALPVSAQTVTRVSVSSTGEQGNAPTTAVTISESGRWVAMQSSATNLVSGDSNGADDVFLHDRNWGATTRISVATGGAEATGASGTPSISGSGERITFESTAMNLVAGFGPAQQIYVHDRLAGTTVAASAIAGNDASSQAQISLDGQWVVFQSDATNLVAGDTNGATDVFLAEVATGATTRLSVSSGGEANGPSTRPTVSADGRWVTFGSSASNLVPGDTNGVDDVFLHDTLTGQTTRVSTTSAGLQANGATVAGAISPDGGFVGLASDASNLVPGDTNGARDIFVKVLGSGLVVRVSVSSSGVQGSGNSFTPGLSWYGSEVSFHSLASLAPGDTNGARDVYRHDLDSGTTTLISATASGMSASGTSWLADLDTGGRVTVFQSDAPDLVAGDTNGVSDAFVQLQKATWYIDVAGAGSGTGTPGNPYTSIQYAIDRPQTVGGDELLVGPGTYYENLDLRGKSLVLRSVAGSQATIVDANGSGTALTIASGENPQTTIEGLTFTGGAGTRQLDGTMRGGGANLVGTSPTFDGCAFEDNQFSTYNFNDLGAGLCSSGGSPWIQDCMFEGNWTNGSGGGAAFIGGSPTLEGCRVQDNVAWYGEGGGLYLAADSVVKNTTILRNGGFYCYGGGVMVGVITRMYDCDVRENWTDEGDGGGILVWGELEFYDGLVEGNGAVRGGGIANQGDLYMEDSTIRGNSAGGLYDSEGAGIWSSPYAAATAHLVGCLVVENQVGFTSYGGLGGAVFGPAVLDRCTLVGNVAQNAGGVLDQVDSLVNCLVYDNAPNTINWPAIGVKYSNVEGGYPGIGNIDEDPLFWDPEGGDFHLRPGSPCIDAGDPTSPLDPDGSIADMGAFPFDPDYCPPATSYCTAGTSGNGCMATISATGTPSLSSSSGFDVSVTNVEGQKQGIIFWGLTSKAAPWGGGTSYLCVQAPAKRTGTQDSGGTAGQCDGSFSLDFNAWMAANPGKAPGLGDVVYMQAWFRDPPSPKTTSLSDGLRLVVCQ